MRSPGTEVGMYSEKLVEEDRVDPTLVQELP